MAALDARGAVVWNDSITSSYNDGSMFGYSVAVDNDTLAVGAPGLEGYVVVFAHHNNQWYYDSTLSSTESPGLGCALALSRAVVLVLANNTDGSCGGSVHIFARVDGVWGEEVQPPVRVNASSGDAIALTRTREDRLFAVIGDESRGCVFVWYKPSGNWALDAVLRPLNAEPGFGHVVAARGTFIAVASYSLVSVYQWKDSSWSLSASFSVVACKLQVTESMVVASECPGAHNPRIVAASLTGSYNITLGDAPGGLPFVACDATLAVSASNRSDSTVALLYASVCGDGRLYPPTEDCDPALLPTGCNATTCKCKSGWSPSAKGCTDTCGNGKVEAQEGCDDGGTANGDGCSSTCVVEPHWKCSGEPSKCTRCGNGIVTPPLEECDDGNSHAGDGCSPSCAVEPGWLCFSGSPSHCTRCGDGNVSSLEQCDDGNNRNGDGCMANCTVEPGWYCLGSPSVCNRSVCGDSIVSGGEQCDSKYLFGDMGCSRNCTVTPGWRCTNPPLGTSTCWEICGDGIITPHEECDDGNNVSHDGCTFCNVDGNYSCTGQPSVCIKNVCGDGIISGKEMCDDGNARSGDGCSSLCYVELGYKCTGVPSNCTWLTCHIVQTSVSKTDCSCFSYFDGTISIAAYGGRGPLFFGVAREAQFPPVLWFPESAGSVTRVLGLDAGRYLTVIKDSDNCYTNGTYVEIYQPRGVNFSRPVVRRPTCWNSSDGSIEVRVASQLPMTYALTGGNIAIVSFQNQSKWTGLVSGDYLITVLNGGCREALPVTVGATEPMRFVVLGTQNASCDGRGGSAQTSVLANRSFFYNVNKSYVASTLDNLKAGFYRVQLIDAMNCVSEEQTFTILPTTDCPQTAFEKFMKNIPAFASFIAALCVVVLALVGFAIYWIRSKRQRSRISRNDVLLENMSKYS
eukprot:m51a1_g9971 hypothetical protein (911) ;mRNA; r:100047-103977